MTKLINCLGTGQQAQSFADDDDSSLNVTRWLQWEVW
jgi:hypothetical protein